MEEERYMSPELAEQNKAIESLQKQSDYLVDVMDKLNERLSSMGKFMADSNKSVLAKIEDNGGKLVMPRYTIKPTQSAEVGEIAKALSKAKAEFTEISKGGTANRGKFSDISDLLEATTPTLEKYELAVVPCLGMNEHGEFTLSLKLIHGSSQWIETSLLLHEDQASVPVYHQKIGAAEKYLRRYMFRCMFNLAEED